ncbi:hypothetical protein ZIOFF_076026 [Zingiber officinale]|uniref:Uncharacterized protein n=1 Tax=Zingiber officinale TaxID=94328 RepID=A0A8J5ER37_ZINOF|nr:hypothetical protein ZIOFF_076026 [Zingiber officinale]
MNAIGARRHRPFLTSGGSKPHRQRRCRHFLFLCCLLLLIFLAVVRRVLALTIFKIRNPSAALVSVRVVGASPHFTLLSPRVDVNITLDLLVRGAPPQPQLHLLRPRLRRPHLPPPLG